jgi:hypothetical protein
MPRLRHTQIGLNRFDRFRPFQFEEFGMFKDIRQALESSPAALKTLDTACVPA